MKKRYKFMTVLLLSAAMLAAEIPGSILSTSINEAKVFLKQEVNSVTCVLASNAMMLRRKAILLGSNQWDLITEAALEPDAWIEGIGVRNSYTFQGMNVSHGTLPSNNTKKLIELLSIHPEGIVVYDDQNYHAILLTDYTNGVFYGSDPSPWYPEGRVKVSSTSLQLSKARQYWYIASSTQQQFSLKLSASSLSLHTGQSGQLTAFATGSGTIDWSSSNENIAAVDANGRITAKKAGTATITAMFQGLQQSCRVTITNQLAESIKLDTTSLTMNINTARTLHAALRPAAAVDQISWSSSQPGVASVDASGSIRAIKAGNTTITATTKGGHKAVCQVKVQPIVAASVKLNATSKTIYKGSSYQLKAVIAPTNTADKKITWTSSSNSIAAVSSSGTVTAKKEGTATITAKTANGKKTTCKITVKNPVNAKSVKLNVKSKTIYKGKTYQLKAVVSPSNTTTKKVSWTSSNKAVATVSSGGNVTAKKAGTATITVKTANGKKTTCKFTVKNPVNAKSVKLNAKSRTVKKGKTYQLKAVINPNNTTYKSLTWSSSNSKIASVSSKGKVTAKKKGTATITVKTANGKKAVCKIKVS